MSWVLVDFSADESLLDTMPLFLPHLRLLSVKCKDFAGGTARPDWLTMKEQRMMHTSMASSKAAEKDQIVACSRLTKPRKKPIVHSYLGSLCVTSTGSQTFSVPNNELNYELNGIQFSLHDIYVHDIKLYIVVKDESFMQTIRTKTVRDGLVTLELDKTLKLHAQISYKLLIKIWCQHRCCGNQECIAPDGENHKFTTSKWGSMLLVNCGGLFHDTISKIESISIYLDEKPKGAVLMSELQFQSPTKSPISDIRMDRKLADDSIALRSKEDADKEPEDDGESMKEREDFDKVIQNFLSFTQILTRRSGLS
jgi:hypothetical protein